MNAEHFADYQVKKVYKCVGDSIKVWNDGSSSNYGKLKGISNCKETCNMHDECEGFTHRLSTGVCGFWKRAPVQPYYYVGYNCYIKPKGSTILYVLIG